MLIGVSVLLVQLILIHNHLFSFQWGQLHVISSSYTNPLKNVIAGRSYLKSIVPDSLKQYDFDCTKVFVTQELHTEKDPEGLTVYYIKGEITGKNRMNEQDKWVPEFYVEEWRQINPLKDWSLRGLFLAQLILLIYIVKSTPPDR